MRIAQCNPPRFVPFIVVLLCSAFVLSCSSSTETRTPPVSLFSNHSAKRVSIPNGWSVAPNGQKSSHTELRLVRNDNAVSMIVRELKPIASTTSALMEEDVFVLGNISMQSKLGNGKGERRVLRPPSVIGNGKQFCVYIYSEDALLRRVLVFRSRSTIYEVELLQENESLSFSSVVETHTAFARSLMNGKQ